MLKIFSPSKLAYVKVYSKEEADEQGIEYVRWVDAEAGQWAITDDDYVFEMLGVNRAQIAVGKGNQQIKIFKTPWGLVKWNSRYNTKKFRCEGRTVPFRELNEDKIKRYLRGQLWDDLALVYSLCFDPDVAMQMVCPDITPYKRKVYKVRMKSDVFKSKVMANVRTALEQSGIDQVWVLDQYKDAVDLAKKKGDIRALATILDSLGGITGLKDKQVTKVEMLSVTERMRQLEAGRIEIEGASSVEPDKEIVAEAPAEEGAELVRSEAKTGLPEEIEEY